MWFLSFLRFFLCLPLIGWLFPTFCNDSTESSFVLKDFISQTTIAGDVTTTIPPTVVPSDNNGDFFKVVGEVTTRSGGIVSLANAYETIESLTCDTGSSEYSVTLEFPRDAVFQKEELLQMFPPDAVLVVNQDLFGPCWGSSINSTAGFNDVVSEEDAYMLIDSVELTTTGAVVIKGVPAYFFSMFESGAITATLVEDETRNLQQRRGAIEFTLQKVWRPIPYFPITTTGTLIDQSSVRVVDVNFGRFFGMDFTIEVAQEYSVQASVETELEVGIASFNVFNSSIVSQELVANPTKLLSLLKKTGYLGKDFDRLAEVIKVGPYFEVDLVVDFVDVSIKRKVGPFFEYNYNSGRKVVELKAFVYPATFDAGITQRVLSDTPATSTFVSGVRGLNDEKTTIEAGVFVGLRTSVNLYVTKYIVMGVGVDSGIQLNAKTSIGAQSFPPLLSSNVATLGPCDDCHDFEGDIYKVLKLPVLRGSITLPFRIFVWDPKEYKIELGSGQFQLKLLSVCAWAAEKDITCGDTCCDSSPDGICVVEEQMCCYPEDECCSDEECSDSQTCMFNKCVECSITGQKECNGECIPINQSCCSEDDDPCSCTDCVSAGAQGDPHIVTFDNLRYSCQAEGDFVFFRSSGSIEAHAHFKKKDDFVSLATGLALTSGAGETLVEVYINVLTEKPVVAVDGSVVPSGNYDDSFVRVTSSLGSTKVFVKSTGISFYADLLRFGFPHFNVRSTLPADFINSKGTVVGLLGTPDGNPFNDWMDSEGNPISFENRHGNQYKYCIETWCLSSTADSLFTNSSEFPFVNGCNETFPGSLDISDASEELLQLCGNDIACLTDGIELGLEGARSLLETEAIVFTSSSLLQVVPSAIVAGTSVNAVFTIDLSRSRAIWFGLESFRLFIVDSETLLSTSADPIASLWDVGSGAGNDDVADDLVFSNVVSIAALEAGESLSYQAVPVINGAIKLDSPLTVTRVNAIRFYSPVSGIGEEGELLPPTFNETSTFNLTLMSIENVDLVVKFSSPDEVSVFQSSTLISGGATGFNEMYLTTSADELQPGSSRTEFARFRLGDAFRDGLWNDQEGLVGLLFAGYTICSPTGQSGAPISVTLSTETNGIPHGNSLLFVLENPRRYTDSLPFVAVFNVEIIPCIEGIETCAGISVDLASSDEDRRLSGSPASAPNLQQAPSSFPNITLDSINDVVLVVEYTYSTSTNGLLRSNTFFLDAFGGQDSLCADANATGADYMEFVSSTGSQVTRIRLGDAYADGQWDESEEVPGAWTIDLVLSAGWSLCAMNGGPVMVSISTETAGVPDENAIVYEDANPNVYGGDCFNAPVGVAVALLGPTEVGTNVTLYVLYGDTFFGSNN